MKKEDLKNGTIIQLRNRVISIVRGGYFEVVYGACSVSISVDEYNDDLTHKFDSCYDIMKITHAYSYSDGAIWDEERDEIILNNIERNYLTAVIAPFRERVVCIEKKIAYTDGYEFIKITVKSDIKCYGKEYIYLPLFNIGTMYKRMKQEKEYTLKELSL